VDLEQRCRKKGALKVDDISARAAEEAGNQCFHTENFSEAW